VTKLQRQRRRAHWDAYWTPEREAEYARRADADAERILREQRHDWDDLSEEQRAMHRRIMLAVFHGMGEPEPTFPLVCDGRVILHADGTPAAA
jgi:hypothetical protein